MVQQLTQLIQENKIFWRMDTVAGTENIQPGEMFSSIPGGLAGEFSAYKLRFRSTVNFQFLPSTLQTLFHLNDLTISVPSVYLQLFISEEVGFLSEAGWIAQVVTGYGVSLSEAITVPTVTKKFPEGEKQTVIELAPTSRAVQLNQQIDIPPAVPLEVILYPFMRIVEAEKVKVSAITCSAETPFVKFGPKQTGAIAVYDQTSRF